MLRVRGQTQPPHGFNSPSNSPISDWLIRDLLGMLSYSTVHLYHCDLHHNTPPLWSGPSGFEGESIYIYTTIYIAGAIYNLQVCGHLLYLHLLAMTAAWRFFVYLQSSFADSARCFLARPYIYNDYAGGILVSLVLVARGWRPRPWSCVCLRKSPANLSIPQAHSGLLLYVLLCFLQSATPRLCRRCSDSAAAVVSSVWFHYDILWAKPRRDPNA
jgi:hypothetical protein